ncbi:hypothetical protein PRZ48_008356 [Zasmidium cellare]|uniref:AMP-binding enzyme C-terminal domain-containing protein n=1 Tax=Zasmidium cellare TaxID=395010 RepID=A0ABR0EFV4_ZASCE|nr:hypothetical protein PRZ48_008356 [Zasmidium cellare]
MISIQNLISQGTRAPQDLASLTNVLVGGSQVPNEAMDAFKSTLRSQAVLTPCYGSTELGIVTCGSWGKDISPQIPGNIGTGKQLFNGYCGNAKATDEACITDQQGRRWFRTGDKGRFSADKQLSITGRFKQIFKVDTEEVAPTEVEAVLMKHDGIKDAAVTATEDRNDPRYYETKTYVVTAEDKKVDAQELVDFVASELSCHKAPTGGVTVLKELPRNTMKKVVTRELGNAEPLTGSVGYMNVLSS